MPIEAASVAANIPNSSGNIADLAYRQSYFEPHVVGNGDGNRALSEGTTVYGNTSDGSLIDVAPTRIAGRNLKKEKEVPLIEEVLLKKRSMVMTLLSLVKISQLVIKLHVDSHCTRKKEEFIAGPMIRPICIFNKLERSCSLTAMASRLLPLRSLSRLLLKSPSSPPSSNFRPCFYLLEASRSLHLSENSHGSLHWIASRSFCSPPSNLNEGPAAIDYSSLLQEDEFHRLADSTIHDLQEKFEEYGDSVQVDGFDIDYGNEVLTLKLGDLGTYVLNKQTPNRQIWLSSPVSGPFRFDWDRDAQAWIYRRTKVKLLTLLESEMEQLCGEPISLS